MKVHDLNFAESKLIIPLLAHKWVYNSIYEFCAIGLNDKGELDIELFRDDFTLNREVLDGNELANLGVTAIKEVNEGNHFIVVTMKKSENLVFILTMHEAELECILKPFWDLSPETPVVISAKTRYYYRESLQDNSEGELLGEKVMTATYPARLLDVAVFAANGYTSKDPYPEKPLVATTAH